MHRVVRGVSYIGWPRRVGNISRLEIAEVLRCAYRGRIYPIMYDEGLGFRVVAAPR